MMAQRTVLIVDDNGLLGEMLAFALERRGYRALHAAEDESLEVARREQPALILLDLDRPDPDGAEVSVRLRGDARTAHIPVVAMSADAGQRRAQGTIAQDWLRTPFPLAALYQKVAHWA